MESVCTRFDRSNAIAITATSSTPMLAIMNIERSNVVSGAGADEAATSSRPGGIESGLEIADYHQPSALPDGGILYAIPDSRQPSAKHYKYASHPSTILLIDSNYLG